MMIQRIWRKTLEKFWFGKGSQSAVEALLSLKLLDSGDKDKAKE
jgi:hypothetical protein